MELSALTDEISRNVAAALKEDIGDGDITAALIPESQQANARVITREDCVICGVAWVNEVFHQLDPNVSIEWQVKDGDFVKADSVLYTLSGSARSLLTGERAALNFLQLLSGTATACQSYANLVAHTRVNILDTRKTIPGLRLAQKYAVSQGGCHNHRIGLYDAYLIKENHIAACGGIAQAIQQAQTNQPGKAVEVEVESMDEFQQALDAGADIVMLDNFDNDMLRDAVALNKKHEQPAKLEASGNVNQTTLVPIAETGVDYISIGALTKDCKAVDLSMRLTMA
ncbi:carboxylating nicotinate-nucleotide diphosphorylase [Pseudoteredinibacter isoporae]|uniref:Probable nicotinate-nucleotide pyrophosphorylase [carboxylating] n=1 Tax=Pseudoteredinibacter isoporae TaxID=570281 RepID=A0A7X0JUZ6_9GAMM|nr:carboxylating nicotinate-nucleotide diphosphorylase [Pseudoteredinibacter isoporae]MBB6522762.1 nicotinate-nucleotide pyrophosphorylase (carboxylating) [Pseudoteredinibacter isoporae]NHO88290.1 carboxylating nicotinate-nucleotide diphosphorylase [Pseudoteredinibacter isoporae]NIB23379.1 carboxylating nicotinate-nucleotide diphosphorylase [Pseudoteredinibacter isoporae]